MHSEVSKRISLGNPYVTLPTEQTIFFFCFQGEPYNFFCIGTSWFIYPLPPRGACALI